jgi:uncharacterized membrane protein
VIRQLVISNDAVDSDGFRRRGREVTRVEALSDAVFGFAITLLVVSLEVPASFDELTRRMSGFAAFGVCFAIILSVWHSHVVFFRRYAMQDLLTVTLNGLLLFVIVFYIYPLKFMFTLVLQFMGIGVEAVDIRITEAQAPTLMLLYALSLVAVWLVMAGMYAHAYRQRESLGLDERERHLTRASIQYCLVYVVVSLISIAITLLGGIGTLWMAGMAYALLGPLQWMNGAYMAKGLRSEVQDPESEGPLAQSSTRTSDLGPRT